MCWLVVLRGNRVKGVVTSVPSGLVYLWAKRCVLHVGRQRGDKSRVSQCIAAVAAAVAATTSTGGVAWRGRWGLARSFEVVVRERREKRNRGKEDRRERSSEEERPI